MNDTIYPIKKIPYHHRQIGSNQDTDNRTDDGLDRYKQKLAIVLYHRLPQGNSLLPLGRYSSIICRKALPYN